MKTITLEDGTKVNISEESYRNLQESVKTKFEIGKWYKFPWCGTLEILNYQGDDKMAYGWWNNTWGDWGFVQGNPWEEATKEEIEEALTKEFHKRYKEGDEIEITIVTDQKYIVELLGDIDGYEMHKDKLWVYLNDDRPPRITMGVVYQQGKWAGIVEEKKKKGWYDLIELCDNNKAEILYNGGASFNKSQLVLTFNNIKNIYKAAKRRRKHEKENR